MTKMTFSTQERVIFGPAMGVTPQFFFYLYNAKSEKIIRKKKEKNPEKSMRV
jgi:hypothetical protein